MGAKTETTVDTKAVNKLKKAIRGHLKYSLCVFDKKPTLNDLAQAAALAVRDIITNHWIASNKEQGDAKQLYYLSMEFLMGRAMGNNLANLGIWNEVDAAVSSLGHPLSDVLESEYDPALGNGGLGRLAACFLDSLASLDMPGYGYGIRYDFGLFRQEFSEGYQIERPDHWHSESSPWLIRRAGEACLVPLYGHIEHAKDRDGHYNPMWMDWHMLIGVPYDLPVVGYAGRTVNTLRLFAAQASDEFDMEIFNQGDYIRAVQHQIESETVSKVLYPSDAIAEGRELRLIQEYFLVACSLQDIMRKFMKQHGDIRLLPDKVAIQLNDTHPALAVPELMRQLVDEHDLPWDEAWQITQACCAYTNHTLLPEALEKWPVTLLDKVLPRHIQIIFEINRRFLEQVAERWPGDLQKLSALSLIEEGSEKQIRMANLSIVGSHAVNGVAAVHSELVKTQLVPDFHAFWPEKFQNKTNGVTPRRWVQQANPGLAGLVTDAIGDNWVLHMDDMRKLESHAEDSGFRAAFADIKLANKTSLAGLIKRTTGVVTNPDTLFDVQAKRMHEYKRQLLKVMHIIHEYLCATEDGVLPTVPRTYVFAGKAAPGYYMAKMISKLINSVGDVVNRDPRLDDMMKVAFIPDYKVSVAEKIIPGAELSEQISTAGMEASGTGNMKFAMNGSLTVGTMDGANIEMVEEIGHDYMYIFGLSVEEVQRLYQSGFDTWDYYNGSDRVRRVMDAIGSDLFFPSHRSLFHPVFHAIMHSGDRYLHLADLDAYLDVQARIDADYGDNEKWTRMAILNVARMGKFSSDRTIREYARDIWGINARRPT